MTVYLSLGTNLGDRQRQLSRALAELEARLGVGPERVSATLETPAWGFEGPDFLNLCVLYRIPAEGTPQEQASAKDTIHLTWGAYFRISLMLMEMALLSELRGSTASKAMRFSSRNSFQPVPSTSPISCCLFMLGP